MKKLTIISILLLLFVGFINGQDLLIRYDLVHKNIYYFKVKKHKDGDQKLIPMKNPRIGANRNIKIEYVNINPFIWNQPKMNLITAKQDSVSSFNPFAMLIPNNFTDKFGSLGLGLTRDASAADPQQLVCASSLQSLYDAYDEVDDLKYDYKLTKDEILSNSRNKIQKVMKTTYASTRIDTSQNTIKRSDFELMNNYFKDICQLNTPLLSRSGNDAKVDAFLGKTDTKEVKELPSPKDALKKIEQDYFNVSDADFGFENSFIVSDKDVILHMDFSLTDEYKKRTGKDSIAIEKSNKYPHPVKGESIFIPVKGGVQVSNSAGIGFTYLGAQRKSFYLEHDSVLASSTDNRIVPVVGSFLNVYSRGLGVMNVGGSFGIAVALQETLAINVMFGLTGVIGRKGKLLVSVGLVMAPVSEPSKGYYVGMHTTNPDFPTQLNYKAGGFFFVHYNVGKF